MSQTILNSQATVGTSSVLVTPLSNNFRYGIFCNDSANVIYLSVGEDAVVGKGIRLNASGGSYEISNVNPIKGDIYAIASGAGSNLSFITIS